MNEIIINLKKEFKELIQDSAFYAGQQRIFMLLAIFYFFIDAIPATAGFAFALIAICCALERIILEKREAPK